MMKFHVFVFAFSFVFHGVLADSDNAAPSSLYANPTTCTTRIPVPSPTGVQCGVRGNISNASPLGDPTYIPYENASPDHTCRALCLADPNCRSFRVQYFPAFITRHFTCQIYSTTVASQNFTKSRTLLQFWDRDCYIVSCNTQTTTPPTETACAPAATQAVEDSSFEAAGNGPWTVGDGVALVKNKTNAASGRGYAKFSHTKKADTAVLEQQLTNLNTSAVYLTRVLIKIGMNRLSGNQACVLSYGETTTDIYEGLEPKHYAAQIDSNFMKANTTVSVQLSCRGDPASIDPVDPSRPDLEVFVDDVTVTSLATNCPFVLQLRSADSSINGQYLTVRATDLTHPDENFTQMGRTSNLAAAPRFGQTPIGMVYLQDPQLAPLNRILFFSPGTSYHNSAYLDYASEISAGNSAGSFGSGFESCRVVNDGMLRCDHLGKNKFVFCSDENTLYLDDPASYPAGYQACTSVELAVLFV